MTSLKRVSWKKEILANNKPLTSLICVYVFWSEYFFLSVFHIEKYTRLFYFQNKCMHILDHVILLANLVE